MCLKTITAPAVLCECAVMCSEYKHYDCLPHVCGLLTPYMSMRRTLSLSVVWFHLLYGGVVMLSSVVKQQRTAAQLQL